MEVADCLLPVASLPVPNVSGTLGLAQSEGRHRSTWDSHCGWSGALETRTAWDKHILPRTRLLSSAAALGAGSKKTPISYFNPEL